MVMEMSLASRPGAARILAMSTAVPKKAPCGRPAMNRAAMSMAGPVESALSVLPINARTMNTTMRRFGGCLRPKTSIRVPTHTPRA